MGELPPLHTPQGPGVPRAFRPGFLRVDSSGTSSAPSSRSASFPFLPLSCVQFSPVLSTSLIFSLQGRFPPLRVLRFLPLPSPFLRPVLSSSLHGPIQLPPRISPPSSTRVSLRFLPLPSPFLRPVLSSSLHFVPHTASRFVLLPLPRVSPRDSTLPRFLFSPLPVRLRFPQLPPPFPPASFPFLPLPFVRFSPVLSTLVLFGSPVVFPPIWRSDSSPFFFRIPGSAAALSRLGFCGPRVAPKRPHTTPEKRQS